MNRFERRGIVGCRHLNLWRTADGYQTGTDASPPGWRAFGGDSSVGGELVRPSRASPSRCGPRRWRWPAARGISRTAKTLRVNYHALKKRVDRSCLPLQFMPGGGPVATFVELAPPDADGLLPMHAGVGGRRRGEDAGPSEGDEATRPGSAEPELLESCGHDPDHAADADPGGHRAGRFSQRDRRPGPGLQGGAQARSVWRLGVRVPQPASDGVEDPGL